jgi:CBS domain containing-hemolysin-like protein
MLEWVLFRLILVAFVILANSFFVAAEFAIVSVRETRIQQLIALGRPGARTALKLKHTIDEFLPAVQLGVTLAALALGWIGEPAVADVILHLASPWLHTLPYLVLYAHTVAVVLAFGIITYFEVLLGELVPKSLALQRAERIALAVSGPMDVFIRITRPIVKLLNVSATVVLGLFRAPLRGEGGVHSPEELKLIATATRRMGLLPAFQEEIIHRAIELNHVIVREIMTPRGKIFSLPVDMRLEDASARIVEEQRSRIPVYDPSAKGPSSGRDNIVGIVYSKDVSRLTHLRSVALSLGGRGSSGLTLRQIMRPVMLVPETKLAVDLLQEFQRDRRQIAIVVDEFGSTVGLITAEDILEQLVGELDDEFDTRSTLPSATGVMSLEGSTTLRDLTTQLHWSFPRETGVETLAGFLLTQLGHIPRSGESIIYDSRRYTVIDMVGHRISRIRVEPVAAEIAPALEAENREAAI